MNARVYTSVVALAISTGWALPAHAAPASMEAVFEEMAAMRADMGRMAERITTLEGDLSAARATASEASAAASAANEAASVAVAAAIEVKDNPPVKISWKGGPKLEGEGGWSFKPRGRLNYDAGVTSAPGSTGRPDGWGNEARRARLGVEGDIPGGFGYKFEVDFAGNDVAITDAILTYKDGGLKVTVGQHKNFQGLEELSSSRFISMMERAAFTDAFGFERRVGLSAQYGAGDFLVQGGVFTDNIDNLSNKSWSVDGRAVYMPKAGGTQLHVGGSVHYSKLKDASDTVRYRQRPFVHFTGERFINTGSFSGDSELGIGVEAAAIAGRFHAAAEGYWQKVNRPMMLASPTFFGGYAEVGAFLTGGDERGYKSGKFGRVKPANPVDEGGIGAVQVNLRYDHLDLSDAGIVGGTQNGVGISLIWTPTDYTRFMVNYGRMDYDNAVHPAAGGDTSYGVDAFGVRAQIDF
jgi:phosphate-selective porin OprO and OprP